MGNTTAHTFVLVSSSGTVYTPWSNSSSPSTLTWAQARVAYTGWHKMANPIDEYHLGEITFSGHWKLWCDISLTPSEVSDVLGGTLGQISTTLHTRLRTDLAQKYAELSPNGNYIGWHTSGYQQTDDMLLRVASEDWRGHGYNNSYEWAFDDGVGPGVGPYITINWEDIRPLYGFDFSSVSWWDDDELPCRDMFVKDDEYDDLVDGAPSYTNTTWDATTDLWNLRTRIILSATNAAEPPLTGSDGDGQWFYAWEIGDASEMHLWKGYTFEGDRYWERQHFDDTAPSSPWDMVSVWGVTTSPNNDPAALYCGFVRVDVNMGEVP